MQHLDLRQEQQISLEYKRKDARKIMVNTKGIANAAIYTKS